MRVCKSALTDREQQKPTDFERSQRILGVRKERKDMRYLPIQRGRERVEACVAVLPTKDTTSFTFRQLKQQTASLQFIARVRGRGQGFGQTHCPKDSFSRLSPSSPRHSIRSIRGHNCSESFFHCDSVPVRSPTRVFARAKTMEVRQGRRTWR